jgi:mRNA-degrading endonuclease RelE of RelBE toxin-antitoxin system
MFTILFTAEAEQDYRALDARWRAEIREALREHLTHEPRKESKSRIKRLREVLHPEYRLRVGEMRVYYDVAENTVTVVSIVPKGRADDWLRQYGQFP